MPGVFLVTALALTGHSAWAATVDCQADRASAGNVLYLYFPTSSDTDFPEDVGGLGFTTSPLAAFDVDDLDPGVGSTGDLRDAVVSRIKADYCEFNVRIVSTTSSNGTTDPQPSDDRWQVVGIGSDFSDDFSGPDGVPDGLPDIFGIASAVDTGDAIAQDFARVYAGSFDEVYGGAGGELNGADSTLGRWANAIAGTTSHEAGHNYGLGHAASIPTAGEGPRTDHLMASGSAGNLTGADRVEDRHFSNTSFELLAANIGLYQQTVSNWDFVNPNDSTADGFSITILVEGSAGTPSVTSVYTGNLSPWNDVSVSADGSETFQGTNYNRFVLDFVDPKGWANGDAGEVDAGDEFHVGVGLDTNYIVRETEFSDGGTVLALRPRVVGYTVDASFDPETGDYHATLFNDDPSSPLIVSDIEVMQLPRTVAIDQMVTGGGLFDDDGEPIVPWAEWDPAADTIVVEDSADLSLGNLANPRAVDFDYESEPGCEPGVKFPPPVVIEDATGLGEIEYCPTGPALGLFPSARVFVTATVTDPETLHFDPDEGRFVIGPVSTRLFFQVTGKKPDLNGNGVDDAIDIDTGACEDEDGNGVCDDAVPDRFKYAAKFICGIQPKESDGRLVRGVYATTVNVLNPLEADVRLSKALSLSYPPEEQRPGKVLKIADDLLRENEALKVDCADVERRLFPDGLPASYIEGFVTIESFGSLDVTAVYSSRDLVEAPRCEGSGYGKKGGCDCATGGGHCRPTCKPLHHGTAGCQPPDAVSTTLDVEQIRERLLKKKKPPVRTCPDLTVTNIGGPKVSCPKGAGSCRTSVDYRIANIGDAASGPFQALATLDPAQSVTVSTSVGSGLEPGQSTDISITTEPGGNCFDPDCTVTVEADSEMQVEECREDNNTLSRTDAG